MLGLALCLLFYAAHGLIAYYIWDGAVIWVAGYLLLLLLALLIWLIVDVVLICKRNPSRRLWRVWSIFTGCTAVTCMLLSLLFVVSNYDARTFEFLWKLRQAKLTHRSIYVHELTSFAWEKICHVGPYFMGVQELIGNEYPIENISTAEEGLSYLIFGLPDKRVLAIGIPRSFLPIPETPKCLTYQTAKNLIL